MPASLQPLATPFNDGNDDVRIQLACCEVIHEEQRLRALHQDVVDAMIDEIRADRVVPIHHHRDLQLGADAVRARHQHGLLHPEVAGEHAAEASDVGQTRRGVGGACQSANTLNGRVGVVDVDAGVLVRNSARS